MSLDDWCFVLQLIGLGLSIGLGFGDFLDRRDPLSWKYFERRANDRND